MRFSEHVRGPVDAADKIRRRDLVLAALLSLGVERGLEERHGRHARDLERVLEGQEQPFRGALVGLHLEEVFAIEQDLALRDLIFVLAGDDIGKGRFAGAVRPHDGGDFACLHGKGHPLEDRLAVNLGVEVTNFEHVRFR
jgi:hypothetical protein